MLVATLICHSLAQGPGDITEESANVCGFSLKTNSGALERTDNYDIVPATKATIWPVSSFFITNSTVGHLYAAGNGDRCGFGPQLQCLNTSKTITGSKEPFTISNNGSLLYVGQAIFSICHSKSVANQSYQDTPFIFPYNVIPPTFTNCTTSNIMATACRNASEYTSHPTSAATQTQGYSQSTSTSTSDSERPQPAILAAVSILFLVGTLMACL